MSYRLHAGEPVAEGVRRIAVEQIDRALADLEDPAYDLHGSVHQLRKRCKKLRSLLRLVRPALAGDRYAAENAAIRDAQGELSALRDAAVRPQTLDALLTSFDDELDREAFAPVGAALRARRDRVAAASGDGAAALDPRITRCRDALCLVRKRVPDWTLEAEGFDAVRGGVRKTYRRGRRALASARSKPSEEAFHEWRKRAKYHLHHVRLLRETWSEALEARRDALDRLTDRLGDAHDLAVLGRHLRAQPVEGLDARVGEALDGLMDARRAALRRDAVRLGRRLFAEPGDALVDRLGAWFEVAWEDEPATARELAPAVGAP